MGLPVGHGYSLFTNPFFSCLRKNGHLNSLHIDDYFLIGDSILNCEHNIKNNIKISDKAGFIVHPEKSVLIPSQVMEFLVYCVLNSRVMTVAVSERQALKIKGACQDLLENKSVNILDLAEVVGLLVASAPGAEYAPIHYKRIDNEKSANLRCAKGNFDLNITLSHISEVQHIAENYRNHHVVMGTDNCQAI